MRFVDLCDPISSGLFGDGWDEYETTKSLNCHLKHKKLK